MNVSVCVCTLIKAIVWAATVSAVLFYCKRIKGKNIYIVFVFLFLFANVSAKF